MEKNPAIINIRCYTYIYIYIYISTKGNSNRNKNIQYVKVFEHCVADCTMFDIRDTIQIIKVINNVVPIQPLTIVRRDLTNMDECVCVCV